MKGYLQYVVTNSHTFPFLKFKAKLRTPSTLLPSLVKIYNATQHSQEHTHCCAVYLDFQTLKVQVLVTRALARKLYDVCFQPRHSSTLLSQLTVVESVNLKLFFFL
uniref:Uncharacterized protein n=1 Tax=Glossina pallidipes TaxID=7398 RepID=A0A1A9ZDW3_GLOPL